MKIVCISDTHSKHRIFDERDGGLPYGDMLVHAGDALMRGSMAEFATFLAWFAKQPHKHKLYVPGNHDFAVEKDPTLCINLMREAGITPLIDAAVSIGGLKFYGSPWVPNLRGWAYYATAAELQRKFDAIPMDTDVLITHGPALGMRDTIPGVFAVGDDPHGQPQDCGHDEVGLHVGSIALLQAVKGRPNLKAHIFGHIHEGYGREGIAINAAVCNRMYNPDNPPIIVEV